MSEILTQSSNDRRAVLMADFNTDYIERGYAFVLEDNFAIATGSTINILIDYTTYTDFSVSDQDRHDTKRKGKVIALPPAFGADTGPMTITLYRGGDYSGGTSTSYTKMNTLSNVAPQVTITTGATGTDKGTAGPSYLVGGQGNVVSNRGGSFSAGAVFVRDNTSVTLLEITNDSASDGTFHYGQIFYEI